MRVGYEGTVRTTPITLMSITLTVNVENLTWVKKEPTNLDEKEIESPK